MWIPWSGESGQSGWDRDVGTRIDRDVTVKQGSQNAEWKETLIHASHALAHLDAERLEEMALCCAALVREDHAHFDIRRPAEPGCGEAGRELESFARVLEATRANLNVMRRLRAIHSKQLEYGLARSVCEASGESEHGNH
jgi:hypothetical protein